jgi:membrane associated rhomboid family serine protease
MTSTALALTYGTVLTGAVCSAQRATLDGHRRFPRLTVSLCVALSLCLAAQIADPPLLEVMERNAGAIRAGEWYRLLTALFFQDGGLIGGIWNIATLGVLGSLAEQLLEQRQWAVVYAMSALAAELIALTWQPTGAGNSIGVFGLAGAVTVAACRRSSNTSVPLFPLLSGAAAAVLVFAHDIHGAAFGIGALAGLVVAFAV